MVCSSVDISHSEGVGNMLPQFPGLEFSLLGYWSHSLLPDLVIMYIHSFGISLKNIHYCCIIYFFGHNIFIFLKKDVMYVLTFLHLISRNLCRVFSLEQFYSPVFLKLHKGSGIHFMRVIKHSTTTIPSRPNT